MFVALSVSSVGLWAARRKVSWLIYLCTSRAWQSRNTHQTLTWASELFWALPSWNLPHLCCPITNFSKPNYFCCCPWCCCFISLFNFIFTSSCLSSSVYLPSFIPLQGYPGDLNAHCQRCEKETENPHKIWEKRASCWWPQGPVGGGCFERL